MYFRRDRVVGRSLAAALTHFSTDITPAATVVKVWRRAWRYMAALPLHDPPLRVHRPDAPWVSLLDYAPAFKIS
jgi:hypothetical protein